MAKRRRRPAAIRGRKGRTRAEGPGWQLWVVLAGVALILGYMASLLVRDTLPDRTEYDGEVISKESQQRPGELDSTHLRQLVLEQEDGSRLTVEVEASLFEVVEKGDRVRRSPTTGIEAFDRDGERIDLSPPAETRSP